MLHADTKRLRDKKLLALERELHQLDKANRNAPVIPLEEPYQRGWTKTFKLRDDVTRRRDAPEIARVLKKFNTTIYGKTQQFLDHNGEPTVHDTKIIQEKIVAQWNWDGSLMKWILLGHWWNTPGYYTRYNIKGYILMFPAYFLIDDVQSYMVTHRRVVLPEIEQRTAEIMSKFTHTQAWNRINKLHGRRSSWHDIKEIREREELLKSQLDPNEWYE